MYRTTIIIINYNGSIDTIECIESIMNFEGDYNIIVVDNNSISEEFSYIEKWLNNKICIWVNNQPPYNRKIIDVPTIKKNFLYTVLDENQVRLKNINVNKLTIIRSSKNIGFAGANNLGIDYVQNNYTPEFVWLLNNDTVVKHNTLNCLINKMETDKDIGLLGAKLMFYDKPHLIQGVGGYYNKYLGYGYHLGAYEIDTGQYNQENINFDYVIGASMFFRSNFFVDGCRLNESYFLYFEELDICKKLSRTSKLGFCNEAIVYHKEGATIGSSSNKKQRSKLSEYYFLKNRVIFTKEFYPYLLPLIYLTTMYYIFNRIVRGQYDRIILAIKATLNMEYKI